MALEYTKDELSEVLRESSNAPAVLYIKKGEYKVKLVMPEGETSIKRAYAPYKGKWQDKPSNKILVAGIVVKADDKSVTDPKTVRYLNLPPSVWTAIIGLMQKNWRFFDDVGPVLTIEQVLKDGKYSYDVAPIQGEDFDGTQAVYPAISIFEAAQAEEDKQWPRSSENVKDSGDDDDLPF